MAKFGVGDWVIVEGIVPAQITQVNPKLEGHQEKFLKKFGWPHTSWYATDKCGLRAESELKRMRNARNSQFKVGDKVRHIDDAKDSPVGIVKGVYGDGRIKVKFPGLMKGGFDGFKEEELVMANVKNAKFNVGDKVKVYHGTKEGKVLSVEEGMRGPFYKVQLGTLYGVPSVSMFEEKELVAANAVRNGYVPLRTRSGGVERVYDGDRVIYKGKEFTAEKLGSPSLAQGILVGDDGAKVTVSLKDPDLFATNADTSTVTETAVNARWRIIYKNLNGPLFPYGKETYSTKEEAEKRAEELRKQGKKWGSNNSYFVDVVNSKFKPNDLVEWRDAHGRHNSAFYVRDNGDRVTVSIEKDGQGGGLEIPKAWITNSRIRNAKFKAGDKAYVHWFSGEDELVDVISYEPKGDYYIVRGEDGQLAHPKAYLLYPVKNSRARNAAGYVDASSVVLHPGDAVVFKAQYSSHKDDDEWLERNGDTVREVRGNEVKLGPSANDWAKKSDLMVWHNARACNADFKVGDKVTVKGDGDRVHEVTYVYRDGSVQLDNSGTAAFKPMFLTLANAARACNSTNTIVRKALNATALNYSPYAKGAWIHDDKGRNYTVVEDEHWGKDGKAVRLVTIRDEQTKQTKEVPTPEISYRFHMGEAESCRKCGNAALNFSPGDKVSIVDTDIRYGGDKGEVVRKDGFRYVVRLTSRQDKPEVLLQPNQLKAANSEDAQGHEHGSDGKFTSKGGGSDGGDSYEDPKTKRMKERLAKMREKNEALRKDIEARKAGLAQKKADTEKMRAEVMKANVDKWKAGLPKTTNSVVAKALNAVAKNADEYVIRKAFTPGKWLLERKMKSLGDAGSVKAFSSEDEARAYAKSKGLSVVNAVAKNDWEQTYEIKGLPVVLTYRGSPFNDIKATVKGGNRDWIEVARVVASSPVSQAEAEKMVAPKWSRIKRTAPNAVSRNDWVADRTGDYTWRETAKERGIKSALRAAGASYANYLPVNRGSVERMNYDSLSWVVRADESVIDKVAQKMKQLGMEEVSKPTWYQYDEYTVIGYTKIKPMPKNAVAKNYKPTSEFEVGDTVRFKDSVRSVPHDETYKVVKVYPVVGRIIIKSNDGKTSDEFVNDLEIV